MRKDHLAFLIGGLAFGLLFGYALFKALENRPGAPGGQAATGSASIPAPAGPPAPTQIADAAPMLKEINALKGALQEEPSDINALLRLADLYRRVGMWQQIDEFFDRAVETDPSNPDLKRVLANFYHDSERWERAVSYYELALEVSPDDPDLLTDMGVCYRGLRQYEKALSLFSRANQADSNHWQSLFNTVIVAGFDLGRLDDAAAALEKLEQLKPDAPELDDLRNALSRARDLAAGGGGS